MSEKYVTSEGSYDTGWDNMTEQHDEFLERVRELETRDLMGALEKATQEDNGFTVDVGGDYEDKNGYWQARSILRCFYEKGADCKEITTEINKAVADEVADGSVFADIYSGHYNGERDATNLIARVVGL